MFFSVRFIVLLLLVLPATLLLMSHGPGKSGGGLVAFAQGQAEDRVMEEDIVEGEEEEEEDIDVEEEGTAGESLDETADEHVDETIDDEELSGPRASPDAETHVLFVKPLDSSNLPSGSPVRVLVGFANKAVNTTFTVTSLEAAFRYPQDFTYYIQNFTESVLNKDVEPQREASFEYSFFVSENFNSRPFGLTVNLNYRDGNNTYQSAVFNETVNITEPEEGFDGETFFMYVTLLALAALVAIGVQQLLKSFGKGRLLSSKPRRYETGTQNNGDIDMDYIPKENIRTAAQASPRRTPRTSPNQRRSRRNPE